jgi:hypothetical protein
LDEKEAFIHQEQPSIHDVLEMPRPRELAQGEALEGSRIILDAPSDLRNHH